MRRFLSTSSHREEKQDAAAARRDRALHAWRNLGSPPLLRNNNAAAAPMPRPVFLPQAAVGAPSMKAQPPVNFTPLVCSTPKEATQAEGKLLDLPPP
ncbi:MAG: hypothetical protein ACK559_29360, partial [bacterium]